MRNPIHTDAARSMAITAQLNQVAQIGKPIFVSAADIDFFRYLGDRMAAGRTDQIFLTDFFIFFVVKKRKIPFQIGQVTV